MSAEPTPAVPADRPPHVNPDPLLSIIEAGQYTNRGPRFFRYLVHHERIEFVRIGGRLYIRRSVLDAYLAANTTPANPTAAAEQ